MLKFRQNYGRWNLPKKYLRRLQKIDKLIKLQKKTLLKISFPKKIEKGVRKNRRLNHKREKISGKVKKK